MAKVGEGNPYYYVPHKYANGGDLFKVYDRNDQCYGSFVEGISEKRAKLIVDSLNFTHNERTFEVFRRGET